MYERYVPAENALQMPLTAEHYQDIGEVIVLFGHIERMIEWAVLALGPINLYLYRDIAAGKSLSATLDSVEKIARRLVHPRLNEIQSICKATRAANEKRNELVHGHWAEVYDPGQVTMEKNSDGSMTIKSNSPGKVAPSSHKTKPSGAKVDAATLGQYVQEVKRLARDWLILIFLLKGVRPSDYQFPVTPLGTPGV